MREAYLRIHLEIIERESKGNPIAKKALEHILNRTRNFSINDIYSIPQNSDPRRLPLEQLKQYDKIIVCGAYHGMCLNVASITLTLNSISNELDEYGIL